MKINPLRILALVAALATGDAATSRGQGFPGPQPGYGPPAMSAAYGGPPMAYGPQAMPVGYGGPQQMPMYGPAQNAGYESMGGGYPEQVQTRPYWEQVPPNAYFNQVNASQYSDQYQPDAYGNVGYGGGEQPCGGIFAYTRAELFILRRDVPQGIDFASDRVGGPIVLSTDNLTFEHEPGIRALAGFPLYDDLSVEASYFGLHEWTSNAAATDPQGNLFSVYSNFGLNGGFVFTDGATLMTLDYQSELHNAELNFLHRFHLKNHPKVEAWGIAGARYTKLNEELDYFIQTVVGNSSITIVETDNDLVGFQLGGQLIHHTTHKLRLNLDGKLGMMVNIASQRTGIGAIIAGVPTLIGGSVEEVEDDVIALMLDAGAGLSYDLTPWCSVTGGYRVFYLDGVALAPSNFNPNLPAPFDIRTPRLDDDGTVLFHGAHAGFEIRW